MAVLTKKKVDLDKRYQKVLNTPASFDFFVAIHDFIEYIEANTALVNSLSRRIKSNQEQNLPVKYGYLKKIHQGVKDTNAKSDSDLGHERYMILHDLNRIQNKEVSESNSSWKKRELFRKLTAEVYERLSVHLSKEKK